MTDITFVTSNQVKLAHARYLCRNYGVNILYYKKLFYGVGYDEPRVDDRNILLTESIEDAVSRWKKNVSGYEDRLFFIEDTSVKIDALSDENHEFPGVNVKYWMQDINFEKLDYDLKKRGNNRRCSVTSHLVLFLTEELKKKSGIQKDYTIFNSTVYGSVSEKEYEFETQMLYPWLDNKTFNKWFVPDGYTKPVSMLNINDADSGDFRKGAFEQMLHFLEKNGAINNKHVSGKQLNIQFYDGFVVCGRTCAGKSTIGKYLADNYGYYHIEASDFMTNKLWDTHGTKPNVDKHLFAEEVLSVDSLFVVNKVVEYMQEHKIYDRFVITGFRTKEEVDSFVMKCQSERLRLVFIDSCFNERYKRWELRHRDVEKYTEDRFKEIDIVQERMGVGEIAHLNGVLIVDNNIDGLKHFFNSFYDKCLCNAKREPLKFNKLELHQIRISLERAILITLALEYQKDESRTFTTTEISYLINKYFKVIERSKNNVSRYFNQSYYVYYEVKYVNHRNRYKISPIGYSEALMIIRNLKCVTVELE